MKVLVACEYSGIARDAFLAKGHDAMSCDLLPTESPGPHYQGNVMDVLDGWKPVVFASDIEPDTDGCPFCYADDYSECFCYGPTQDGIEYKITSDQILLGREIEHPYWDMMIAHPPCTYLSYAGTSKWNDPGRCLKRLEALDFFRRLWEAPIDKICLENPKGCASPVIAKYSQEIQPFYWGDSAYKTTWLWLKNLPLLEHYQSPTLFDEQTHCLPPEPIYIQNNGTRRHHTEALGGGKDRAKERARFWPSIAQAMAEQWGK